MSGASYRRPISPSQPFSNGSSGASSIENAPAHWTTMRLPHVAAYGNLLFAANVRTKFCGFIWNMAIFSLSAMQLTALPQLTCPPLPQCSWCCGLTP
ncbi:hypothetical protein BDV96DRAFT_563794 [Lophiotrema nucula]|uniref:Uncharacterized protein n=1 Tax=Lophiotrema nucula TaxID=690887 RepID=A0A6A5ZPQ1_9PLEO|nr:hypothetical protein BDV96DRAFT_563794 [Lophiotrema nucula]